MSSDWTAECSGLRICDLGIVFEQPLGQHRQLRQAFIETQLLTLPIHFTHTSTT